MGSLLSYSGVVTKIRAMEKHLISDEEFREIVSLPSVPAIEAYLMKNPRYAEEFQRFPAEEIHRGVLESILGCTVFRDYVKIFHFCTAEQRKFLRKYVRRYEIRLLKKCLSYVCQGTTPKDSMFLYADFFDRYTSLNPKVLASCTSVEELLQAIRDTEYAPVLSKISEMPGAALADYETALDMYHLSTGFKDLAKILPKDSVDAVTAGYGAKLDLLNLWYIHRARAFYHMNKAETFALLIPVRYKLRREEIEALVGADSEEEFRRVLAGTHYGRKYPDMASENPGNIYNTLCRKALAEQAKKNPYSIAAVCNYFYIREHEEYRLTSAVECVRYGVKPDEAMQIILSI
ncbi:MAG: V-type ATPase subunit [Lachnospiraceae bacterium]|nr:V-type ATPase subunit [Lachnospiraceae bacterium]